MTPVKIIQMNFNISKHIHIFFIFYLLNLILCNNANEYNRARFDSPQRDIRCEPGCNNKIDKACNKFEIQLRATMMKCNLFPTPFKPSTARPDEDSCKCHFRCTKKLHITLKVLNQGETETNNQYVIIDHVTDSSTGNRVSLLNPYVVVMRQKPILQLYGLKRGNFVNGEAKEEVINKKDANFMGCDDVSDNPTCGNMRFNGDIVPYSQGFCCSCDEKKNVRRQPRSTESFRSNDTFSIQDMIYSHMKWEMQPPKEYVREKKSVQPWDFNDYRSLMRQKGKNIIYVSPKIIGKSKKPIRKHHFFHVDKDSAQLEPPHFENNKLNDDLYYNMNKPNDNENSKYVPYFPAKLRDNDKEMYLKGKPPLPPSDITNDNDLYYKKTFENDKTAPLELNKELYKEKHVAPPQNIKTENELKKEKNANDHGKPDDEIDTSRRELLMKLIKNNAKSPSSSFDAKKDKVFTNKNNDYSSSLDSNNNEVYNKNEYPKTDLLNENFYSPANYTKESNIHEYPTTFDRTKFNLLDESPNVQIRGGQDCDDKMTPNKKVNPATYQDSAHCLRFSKLWYAMYQVSEPVLDHSVMIKIFEKREMDNGNTEWVDVTGGKTIRVGSLNPKFEDCGVLVSYDTAIHLGGGTMPCALDPRSKRLLIPEDYPKIGLRSPELDGGPSEYLVVDTKNIQTTGELCDTAGVGYSAFYHQPDRCNVPRGTCLRNQPSQLWRNDQKACMEGRRGKYFLKNYAVVPDNAIRRTAKGDSNYLALHYSDSYKSTLDIDIKADDNIIFSNIPLAKITEVYVDSTSETVTVLTIKIHNNGLISNVFRPRLADCPLELPVEWGNLEGDPILIPPQHHSIFTLRLLGILPVTDFYCSVEALTPKNEIIAVRRFRIVKNDRCICAWHCLCACYVKTGLGCVLMSMDHYRAAGFIGSMPLGTTMVKVSYFEQVIFGLVFFSILLVIILLLMGLTKALIGFCFFVPVGIWGLDLLIGLRPLKQYYEDCLRGRMVVYDCDGWPVHPDTNYRCVRIVDEKVEFCLNVIFFFTYPVMLFILLANKLCCPYYTYCGDEDKGTFFQSVNTVSFTRHRGRPSESECCEEMFEFEEYCMSD